jgi:quercetin dioxygenase-like cupin family protein
VRLGWGVVVGIVSSIGAVLTSGSGSLAAELDPRSVEFKAPNDIHWVRNAEGTNEQAVLFGDPGKPGLYVVRIKWLPGNFSHPHFHNSDRVFTVVSGTWWVGTGTTFDPNATVPIPAGSYVIHKAGQVHFDGAKSEEAVIQVTGIGPVTTTPAEKH